MPLGKLQRDPVTKKIQRDSTTRKVLRGTAAADSCCCGTLPLEPCVNDVLNVRCKLTDGTGSSLMPRSYKITVSDSDLCTGCIVDGPRSFKATGGSVNRDFYVEYAGVDVSGNNVFKGLFFCGSLTNAAGGLTADAYDSAADCSGAATPMEYLDVSLTFNAGGVGVTQTGFLSIVAYHGTASGFSVPCVALDGGFVATDFCNVGATYTDPLACGDGVRLTENGTAAIVPCPPCAVDCDGSACASVVITGTCVSCPLVGGKYFYVGKIRLDDILFVSDPAILAFQPAGCLWKWQNLDGDETLYVWFDGADYQGVITDGTGSGEVIRLRSSSAGDVTCTDGTLGGTLTLKDYSRVVAGEASGGGECYDCTATVTLGACGCPDDCGTCCDMIFTLAGTDCIDGPKTFVRSGCEYAGDEGGVTCVDGEWRVSFDDNGDLCGGGTCSIVFSSTVVGPCPSTTIADWTYRADLTTCSSPGDPILSSITACACGTFNCVTDDMCITASGTTSGTYDGMWDSAWAGGAPSSCGWFTSGFGGSYQIGCIDEVDLGAGVIPYKGWAVNVPFGTFVKLRTGNTPATGGGWTVLSGAGTISVAVGPC